MGILVVANLLLLLRDIHRDLHCLGRVAQGSVKLEGVLGLFWNVISFAHEIVYELVRQSVQLCLGHHIDHVRDARLTLLDVQLESLICLLSFLVMLRSTAPLRLALVILSDSQVLINIAFINLEDNLGILVHFLMRLRNNESVLTFPSQD